MAAAHAVEQTLFHQAAERLVHAVGGRHAQHGREFRDGWEGAVLPPVHPQAGQVLVEGGGEGGHVLG